MIFALNYLKIRELVPPKLSCHLRISKSLIALLFRCSINVSSRTRLRVGFRCFEGHVFIETLQSKDFSEILLICVNFGSHSLTGIIKFSEAKISILSL